MDGWAQRVFGSPPDGLIKVAKVVTQFGSGWFVLLGVTAFVLWRTRSIGAAASWCAGAAVVRVVVSVLKAAIGRDRPPWHEAVYHLGDAAMPSGHSANAAFAVVALVFYSGARTRRVAWLAVPAVMWSRIALGVHWFTDTLVGAAIGVAFGAGTVWLTRALPHTVAHDRTVDSP